MDRGGKDLGRREGRYLSVCWTELAGEKDGGPTCVAWCGGGEMGDAYVERENKVEGGESMRAGKRMVLGAESSLGKEGAGWEAALRHI